MSNRLWIRFGEAVPIDRDGYLAAREHWKRLSVRLFTLMDLSAAPCVLLLGEPGMGKTRAITTHAEDLRRHVSPSDRVALLRPQSDPLGPALSALFRSHAEAGPDSSLHLFIDGFDEYLWRQRSADSELNWLLRELAAPLRARLRLRIVCRTQQLPQGLRECLSQLWNEGVTCYELAPLRAEDVEQEAARLPAGTGQTFLEQLKRKRLGSLASRPITLNLLLKLAHLGSLPTNRTDIYGLGCRVLCTEPDPDRTRITRRSVHQDPARMAAQAQAARQRAAGPPVTGGVSRAGRPALL